MLDSNELRSYIVDICGISQRFDRKLSQQNSAPYQYRWECAGTNCEKSLVDAILTMIVIADVSDTEFSSNKIYRGKYQI